MTEVIGEIVAEETHDLPAVRTHEAMVTRSEISVDDVVAQRDKVKSVMERVMRVDAHYGRIPGVAKPTLFKPGAEVLLTTFRLAPSYQSERIFHDDNHLTVVAKCILTHAPSGIVLGEGEGLCSSREEKYAYRNAKRICPSCGVEAIIKGKQDFGGGWLCWKKSKPVAGCGAKFASGVDAIESQEEGKVANDALPDTWNTVLKMADKRALVAAVLNCTAASDIFTQDVEDTSAAAASEPAAPSRAAATPAEEMPADNDPGGEYTLPFGKHKGVAMAEVPRDYLEWVVGNSRDATAVRASQAELDRRDVDESTVDGLAGEEDIPF